MNSIQPASLGTPVKRPNHEQPTDGIPETDENDGNYIKDIKDEMVVVRETSSIS